MPKLKSVTFDHCPKIPGLRAGDLSTVDCDNPPTALKDWKIVLRGGSMYLISPRGWTTTDNRAHARNPKGPMVVHEIPRAGVFLHWTIEDDADMDALLKNGGKYESEPLGWKPAPIVEDKPILSQIPPDQMGDA